MKWEPHIIIDNFLSKEELDFCLNFELDESLIGLGENEVGHLMAKSRFYTDGSDEHYRYHDMFEEIFFNHYVQMHDYLKQLAPEKIERIRYTEVTLTKTSKPWANPPHVDARDKLLSIVVYISENNKGTILHNGDETEEVEWVQNRALIFSRNENTWHSFESADDNRKTLVLNFRT